MNEMLQNLVNSSSKNNKWLTKVKSYYKFSETRYNAMAELHNHNTAVTMCHTNNNATGQSIESCEQKIALAQSLHFHTPMLTQLQPIIQPRVRK